MSTNQKHILLVTSEFPPLPGGIGNHALNLATYLTKNNYQVEVITDHRSKRVQESEFDTNLDFKIHRVPLKPLRLFMYWDRIRFVFRHLKQNDIIIASGKFSLWLVAFTSLFFKRKYIAIIHGTEVNFRDRILKFSIDQSLKRFSKIIAVSTFTKSLIDHLELNNVYIIPNGLDIKLWRSTSTKTSDLKGIPKLITVGTVSERKGQGNVISHLPELMKKYPQLHYHCIGLPTLKKELQKKAEKLGVIDHVTFHGRLNQEEVIAYLKAADIFVMLSSTTDSGDVEGFGIAILEANACGLAAIGSKGCGIEDAIDSGRSGLLIDPLNGTAFKKAIDTILLDKSNYTEMSKAWAMQHSWDAIIKSYIEVLED